MKKVFNQFLPALTGNASMAGCILLGVLSGLFSFLFINSVTRLIGKIIAGSYTRPSTEEVLIFSAIILLFMWTRRVLSGKVILLSQELFWRLRKKILSMVLKTNYLQLQGMKHKIQTALTSDVSALTDASVNIVNFFSSIIVSMACFVFFAFLSFHLFIITIFVVALGVTIYWRSGKSNMRHLDAARKLEDGFFKSYTSLIHGFKEIYMDPSKGKYIYERKILEIGTAAKKNNVIALTGFLNNTIIGQLLFYCFIAVILLYFSVALKIKTQDLTSYVFTLSYLLASIETIMVLLPSFLRAKVAYGHLGTLEMQLAESVLEKEHYEETISPKDFDRLAIRDLRFRHNGDADVFEIGPVNMDIRKGEVIFIFGGNGSGKTTLINTMIGLYPPSSGKIKVNETQIEGHLNPEYRSLFSVVFSDFYLFDELHGVEEANMSRWAYYLQLFELEGKVRLHGKQYSTTDLSTGQRKRLALITVLLERRPVLVLDEWAADQDPHFRKKFYREILPLLKQEGFTIVAITHDDAYFECADKLYRMEFGRLIQHHVNVY